MQEGTVLHIDWCKDICPQLAAFNKVFTIRAGKGLVQNIVLTGSDEDIMKCVDSEAMLFATNGLMLNEIVCTDKNDTTSPQTFYFENDEGVTRQPGSLYFFKSCEAKDCNKFDVTGLYKSPCFDFTSLIEALGLNGLTNEMLQNSDLGKKIEEMLQTMSMEQFVNNTLIAHYTDNDDETYNPDTDFVWFKQKQEIEAAVEVPIDPLVEVSTTSVESKSDVTNSNVEALESTEKSEVNSTESENKTPKHGSSSFFRNGFHKMGQTPASTTESKSVEEKKDESKNEEKTEDSEDFVPAPVSKDKKGPTYTIKKVLTVEEDERNRQLLANIRAQYEEMIEYITKTCNSQWTILKNQMIDELKNNEFKTQWSKICWDISKDNSTELYKKLYDLDEATKKFREEVVHQSINLGCAFCAHNWDEDITFLNPGPHFVECPNCYTERGFEKRKAGDTSDSE